jgi:hypothetical protein
MLGETVRIRLDRIPGSGFGRQVDPADPKRARFLQPKTGPDYSGWVRFSVFSEQKKKKRDRLTEKGFDIFLARTRNPSSERTPWEHNKIEGSERSETFHTNNVRRVTAIFLNHMLSPPSGKLGPRWKIGKEQRRSTITVTGSKTGRF